MISNIKKFRDWSIFWKYMSLFFVIMGIIVGGTIFYFLPLMETRLMDEKHAANKKLVEVAYSFLEDIGDQAASGKISGDAAREKAKATLNKLRYEGSNYFWINDLEPLMIMHPFESQLDGQSLATYKDPNGKPLFVEMANVCRAEGEGFVDYFWPKPGYDEPVPKISFVKLYEPWV